MYRLYLQNTYQEYCALLMKVLSNEKFYFQNDSAQMKLVVLKSIDDFVFVETIECRRKHIT